LGPLTRCPFGRVTVETKLFDPDRVVSYLTAPVVSSLSRPLWFTEVLFGLGVGVEGEGEEVEAEEVEADD